MHEIPGSNLQNYLRLLFITLFRQQSKLTWFNDIWYICTVHLKTYIQVPSPAVRNHRMSLSNNTQFQFHAC